MTLVRLRRHAPEAQIAEACSVCGTRGTEDLKDHLLVGTPGTPTHDGTVCAGCGAVIDRVARKFGSDLTVTVEEAQQNASPREITTPTETPADAAPKHRASH
jgi:hypothetical protein